MYSKQVIDCAELIKDLNSLIKTVDSIEQIKPLTPSITVIENIDSNGTHKYCYEISDGVITVGTSVGFFNTLVEHPKLKNQTLKSYTSKS